jgi:hypothetical protein
MGLAKEILHLGKESTNPSRRAASTRLILSVWLGVFRIQYWLKDLTIPAQAHLFVPTASGRSFTDSPIDIPAPLAGSKFPRGALLLLF